jgi:DNA-nicking Smr family endonuclease
MHDEETPGAGAKPAQLRRRNSLTEQESSDWAAYARQIRPLKGRAPRTLPEAVGPRPTEDRARPVVQPPRSAARAAALAVGDPPGGLDRASWQRFRSGRLPPSRTLDLHGTTAQPAFHALHGFLHAAYGDGVRCVEVITGRGSGEAGGVLRRELPVWLNLPSLRPIVLAAAHPHAANPGAVRLLLRRPR